MRSAEILCAILLTISDPFSFLAGCSPSNSVVWFYDGGREGESEGGRVEARGREGSKNTMTNGVMVGSHRNGSRSHDHSKI